MADIIFFDSVNLDGRVLRINLSFNKTLENFGDPNIEANLTASGNNLEAKMLLDAAGVAKFVAIAQNTVKAGKKLLGGELFFIVGTRNFEHQ